MCLFFFWTVLCLIQHCEQGCSLAPPFLERADSSARMVLAPQEPPGCCGCGVGPWVCAKLSEAKERSAPFSCAAIKEVRPRLMQPKFELQVSSLESNALPLSLA